MGDQWHFRLKHDKTGAISEIHHNNLKNADGSAVITDDDFSSWIGLEQFTHSNYGRVSWSTPIGLSCQQQGINADFKFPFIVNSLPRGLCGTFNQNKNDDFRLFDGTVLAHDTEQETWWDFKLDAEFRVAKSWLISPTGNTLGRSVTGVTTMNTGGLLPDIIVSLPDEGPNPRDVQSATAECDVSDICQVLR